MARAWGRRCPANQSNPNEPTYPDEMSRAQDASRKIHRSGQQIFQHRPRQAGALLQRVVSRRPGTAQQALEELKKISSGGDKELADMAQYQEAVIYSRTGKTDDAIKIYRALADKGSVFVPRPLVLLELAGVLRQTRS